MINNVFNHPNVGPFIGRQLIQHLVTSNPSPAYVGRVTAVFNNNGQGVRGDLRAVVRAILLDPEARGNSKVDPVYGKLREPRSSSLTSSAASAARGECGAFRRGPQAGAGHLLPAVGLQLLPAGFPRWSTGNPSSPRRPVADDVDDHRPSQHAQRVPLRAAHSTRRRPRPDGTPTTSVVLDFAPFDQLAPNPTNLVNELNTRLMHGSMSAQMRQTVIDAVTSIQNNNRLRVQTAIYIIASSMQYQVQR